MKQSKFTQLFNGQSSTAKKVYDAVPINEAWDVQTIFAEIVRKGQRMHREVIHGSLRHLREVGLVKEPKPSHYQRVPVQNIVHEEEHIIEEQTKMATEFVHVPKSLSDIITELAQRAAKLSDDADALRQDIEMAAVHAKKEAETNAANVQKLDQFRQLKQLLNGLED